jgi:hypothetical protein
MAAGVATEHVAEAEQAGRRLSHGLGDHFGIGIGTIAAGKKSFLAEPALPAANGEWDDDPIPDPRFFTSGPSSIISPIFS